MKDTNDAKQKEAITIFIVIILMTIVAFAYFQNSMVIVGGVLVAVAQLLSYGDHFPDERDK